MKVALGSDHAGFSLKENIAEYLRSINRSYLDCGVSSEDSVDYPDIAVTVVDAVNSGECEYGILICGTGIGMSIAANKHKGIRAALCGEPYSAKCARKHNDANVLTMGSRVIGSGLAAEIVKTFLSESFDGGRHRRRLDKIEFIEK
ncbi:MAG: ribose 5-phosphate isomerase B [Bacillota bacterium]